MILDFTPEQKKFRAEIRTYFDEMMTDELLHELHSSGEGGGPLYRKALKQMGSDGLLGGYYVFYRRIIFLLVLGGQFMLLLSLFDNLAAASILTGLSVGPLYILEDRWVRWRAQRRHA